MRGLNDYWQPKERVKRFVSLEAKATVRWNLNEMSDRKEKLRAKPL